MQRTKQVCLSIPALALVSLATAFLPAAAHADTFDFTIISNGTTATGVFNTTDTAVEGSYTVTSITDGSLDGTAITLIGPGTYSGNDNLLSPTNPYFDYDGVGFTDGTQDYEIYYFETDNDYLLCDSTAEPDCHVGNGTLATVTITPTSVTASATPEPSSFVLLGTGALGIAGMLRRKVGALRS